MGGVGSIHSQRALYMMNSSNFKLFFLVSVWRVHVLLCSLARENLAYNIWWQEEVFLSQWGILAVFRFILTIQTRPHRCNRAKWENAVLVIPWNKKTRRYIDITLIYIYACTSKWWFAEKLFMCIKFYYFSSTIHKRIYYYAFHKVSTSSELSDNNVNAKQLCIERVA